MQSSGLNQGIVIDNGGGILKAGFAGEEVPSVVIDSLIGEPKHPRVMAGGVDGDVFVGARATELRGLLRLRSPIRRGTVTDWAGLETLWNHVFDELAVRPGEHPVLVTESPLNARANREGICKVLFESFGVPAVYVSIPSVLSLYASGRTTGLVLDVGDGVTCALPVVEGHAAVSAISRIDLGGSDVDNRLNVLLRKAGYRFETSGEMQLVKKVKEKLCYIAPEPEKAESTQLDGAKRAKYKLPDGNYVRLANERFGASEILFQPHLIGREYSGVHECIKNSIDRVDVDLRRRLYSTVLVTGGSSLFKGFCGRLLSEVRSRAPKDMKIRLHASPERQYAAYTGGSILASLSTFRGMGISADDYREHGNRIIHKKTF